MAEAFKNLQLYFSYPFVRYALIVGVLIAVCSSLLGVTLVLKRFSFIGDGLSHVAFGAMAIAAVLKFTNQTVVILPITVICAILLLKGGNSSKIRGDAAIAMLSAGTRVFTYEYFLTLRQCFGGCVQHTFRLNLNSHPVKGRGYTLRGAVTRCNNPVYTALQQAFRRDV